MAVQNPPVFLQAGSHPAEEVRRYTHAQMGSRPGIVGSGDFAVTQNGTPNMSVNVAAGRAFVSGSQASFQGTYFVESRGTENLAIATADATNARKDLLVAQVEDAAYSGAVNAWKLAVVTGTPAASPSEPAVPANSIVLAMVDVPALDTTIGNAQITDRRVSQGGNQLGRAAGLGGVIVTTSGALPPHEEGRVVYTTDTDRAHISDGSNWHQVALGQQILAHDEFTTTSPTFTTTETDLFTGSAVTLVAGHLYEIRFGWGKVHSTVSSDLATFRIKTGATIRQEWNTESSTTARHGGEKSRFIKCSSQIASGSQTFKVTGQRVIGTGTMDIAADGNARAHLMVIDHGLFA